jgi:uncharacterized protein (TIGR00288 family)
MNTPKQDVAVFIDFENIYVSVREKFDATPNFEALMERCEDYGRIVVARAYADWYRYPRITSALFANNIEPMYVPTYYYDKDEGRTGRPIKNSVDMHMCIDAMRTLYTRTNISTYVFITGDRDFIALVNCVRQEGKNVVIIGIGGAASSHLAQSADEFLFYEQIVDIRPMGHNSRQMQRVERPERTERAAREEGRPERPERSNGRDGRDGREDRRRDRDSRPERSEKPEKSEAKAAELPAEKPAEPTPVAPAPTPSVPAPIVAIPSPSADNAIYDKLIEALTLARKRGYVSSFGSLKVLMKELMPNFKETRYRNAQGKPFTKFTDFVREAERLGKIQIFTSGTVNEVFLPDEDPYKLSQFAEDLPSVEAERELEQELAAEAQASEEAAPAALEASELDESQAVAEERGERSNRRRRRRGGQGLRADAAPIEALPGEIPADEVSSDEEVPPFGDREWALFDRVMAAYSEPVPFADIFNDLREMRNTEELDLTNNALKELIKQAINAGKVQRSNRGAKAHYRLVAQAAQTAQTGDAGFPDIDLPDLVDDDIALPPALINGDDLAQRDLSAAMTGASADDTFGVIPGAMVHGELVTESEPAPQGMPADEPDFSFAPDEPTPTDTEVENVAAAAEAPAVAEPAPKRGRRRKAEPATSEAAAPAPEPATPSEPKPRARRSTKASAEPKAQEAAPASAPAPSSEAAPAPRRRRKKTTDAASGESGGSTEGVE